MDRKQYKQRLQKLEAFSELQSARKRLNFTIKEKAKAQETYQKADKDWKPVAVDNVQYWGRLYREAKTYLRESIKHFRKIVHSKLCETTP